MPRKSDTAPSPEQIRALRGARSRAALGELLGVTGLTVYRWELPPEADEARRPRGAVLARLLAFIEKEGARAAPIDESAANAPLLLAPGSMTLDPEERARLAPPLAAMDDGRLEQAEAELLVLLASGALRSEAARAHASTMLARIQLLARHDTKGAFATLLGVGADVGRLPRWEQLEYHLTAAFLHAHSDAQLFNPGKTNHHVALAERLMSEVSDGHGDHRFFLWYAQLTAAMSLYDVALIARAMGGFPAVRDLASTALHRCLAEEALTLSRLGLTSTVDPARDIDGLRTLADAGELPLQQIRARIWRAEVMLEGAAPPHQILTLLDDAEHRHRRHRVANGIHAMLMNRNRAEILLRIGDRRAAEDLLIEAARIGRELAYTPIRISTTLARLYLLTDRLDDFCKLGVSSSTSEDVQKELTRALGGVLALLAEVHRGDAAADWCDRLLERLAELRRLGPWPMAYRNLVLVSLTVAASKGAVSDAERVLLVAERATEWSTSPAGSASYRRHRATILMRRGRFAEARRSLEAALATFDAAGDLAEAALGRRALANVELLEKAPEAEARLRETSDALAALGIPAPPLVGADAVVEVDEPAPPTNDDAGEHALSFEQLLVPLQRLATRGIGAALLGEELVAIVSELLPGRRARLEQIDAAGLAKELVARDGLRTGASQAAMTWFELTDGVGARLRLGVGAPLHTRQRAAIEIVVSAATMAFEIAALRGLSAPTEGRPEPPNEALPPAMAELVAASASMRRLRSELGRLSGSRATIIVTGESGTGKEVIARAIHALSRRAAGPYITFNSATVPRDLFESQLFGHKRGAFTGATADHPGVIRAADGGTLFLDEIGELPLDVQPKLLRFLENGEVLPLGEHQPLQVDVRIIAATHRDLLRLVREGKFREDLYYRLSVIPVNIAPLRERKDDILALARHFIRRLTPREAVAPVLSVDGETKLIAHAWPGNVRELRNVIERSLAFEPLPRLLGAAELRIEAAWSGRAGG